jgi:hypothetical protein
MPAQLAQLGTTPDEYIDTVISSNMKSYTMAMPDCTKGILCDAGAEPRVYTQISDPNKMLLVLKEYLSDYNAISKKPMQLVLFQFALEHVSRICRIITSPGVTANTSSICWFALAMPSLCCMTCFIAVPRLYQSSCL